MKKVAFHELIPCFWDIALRAATAYPLMKRLAYSLMKEHCCWQSGADGIVHNNEGNNHHKSWGLFLNEESRLPWAYPLIKRHRLVGCQPAAIAVIAYFRIKKCRYCLSLNKEISPNSYHGLLRNWEVAPGLLRNWEVATVLAYFLIKKCRKLLIP